MQVRVVNNIQEISPQDWDRLAGTQNPFVQHAFLAALERHGCVGERFGWLPHYLIASDGEHPVGAVPMYLKDNSYGEFVFDSSWADAYQRAGLAYYPKLVIGIPYTPATGPRLLLGNVPDTTTVAETLIAAATAEAEKLQVSSVHWLFPNLQDTTRLQQAGLMLRMGCQFHWENHGYRDFADYLEEFSAAKRKKIKRERRRVQEQGIELEILHGDEVSAEQWKIFHDFYTDTFNKKWGLATLSQGFFQELGQTMGNKVVLVFALHAGRYVASAFNIRGKDTLYGRHWGCNRDFHSLHFEACYYQGLDYCLRHGLQRFEPGAQGEHKISRGFLPVPTWSAHWIANPQFAQIIDKFLAHERNGMAHYIEELVGRSPFKGEWRGTRDEERG